MGMKNCLDYLSDQVRGNSEAKRIIQRQLLYRRNTAVLLHGLIALFYIFQFVQALASCLSVDSLHKVAPLVESIIIILIVITHAGFFTECLRCGKPILEKPEFDEALDAEEQ